MAPHHIAERYGLLVIIALGEVVLGTTTAVAALVDRTGWSTDAIVVAVAGIALAVGVWWCYFALPWGALLDANRRLGFRFGYGHMPLYAVIAAIGAGLHVVAYVIEGESVLTPVGAIIAIAIPVGLAVIGILLFAALVLPAGRSFHLHLSLLVLSALGLAVALAALRLPLAWCLGVVVVSPWLAVAAYELRGHEKLNRLLEQSGVALAD